MYLFCVFLLSTILFSHSLLFYSSLIFTDSIIIRQMDRQMDRLELSIVELIAIFFLSLPISLVCDTSRIFCVCYETFAMVVTTCGGDLFKCPLGLVICALDCILELCCLTPGELIFRLKLPLQRCSRRNIILFQTHFCRNYIITFILFSTGGFSIFHRFHQIELNERNKHENCYWENRIGIYMKTSECRLLTCDKIMFMYSIYIVI